MHNCSEIALCPARMGKRMSGWQTNKQRDQEKANDDCLSNCLLFWFIICIHIDHAALEISLIKKKFSHMKSAKFTTNRVKKMYLEYKLDVHHRHKKSK